MEPPTLAKYVSNNSYRYLPGSTSMRDSDMIETASFDSEGSGQSKRKLNQVVSHDLIEIDGDEDPSGAVISSNKDSIGTKNKAVMSYVTNWQKPAEVTLAEDNMDSNNDIEVESAHLNPFEVFGPGSLDSNHPDKLNSDSVTNDDDKDDVYEDDENYGYDDNEDMDYDDYDDGGGDDYYDYEPSLDAQFDAVDLPAGVEASVPWLTDPSLPSTSKPKETREDDIEKKYREFKHFDTVSDCSDHHFATSKGKQRDFSQGVSLSKKAPKDWNKTIQQEWTILEKDLPETIFVRAYEERLDLLRAVIVGAAGTPYHDGLFFFDVSFPPTYPSTPPLVHYHSGGLRLNPNLYNCGKVCLSLLNTWHGAPSERWTPGKSTMLQVLVSIQALVLNEKPYFNEPGYEKSAGKPVGEMKSVSYNEDVFVLSCKTMLYTLRKPPQHFEDFVAGHFRLRAHNILQACKAYLDGAPVGGPVLGLKEKDADDEEDTEAKEKDSGGKLKASGDAVGPSPGFKTHLGKILPTLLVALADNGADCRQFVDKPDNPEPVRTLRVHKFND